MNVAKNIIPLELHCTKCGVVKSIDNFWRNNVTYQSKRGQRASHCKECKTKSRVFYEILLDSDPRIAQGYRVCRICKENKCLVNFRNNRAAKLGRSYYCKDCGDKKTNEQKKQPAYRLLKKTNGTERNWNYKKYGMTTDEVRTLLDSQFGLCANRACGKEITIDTKMNTKNKAFVDHCHATGKVRGMLCITCNTVLGHVEQKNRILGLTEYLHKHSN